jgi:hypothetical protein
VTVQERGETRTTRRLRLTSNIRRLSIPPDFD